MPLLGIYPEELKAESQRDICTFMFTAALFTMAKRQMQPKCPRANEWRNKMWHTHMMECYSAIKMKEVLLHATPWMNLEDIVLSEKPQYCMITLMRYLKKSNSFKQKVEMVVIRG